MRVLSFTADGQYLKKEKSCDFKGIIRGSKGYLKAVFFFSADWAPCVKVASFWKYGKEYAVPIINGECMIPDEVTEAKVFSVSVSGRCKDYRITTNKSEIRQEG